MSYNKSSVSLYNLELVKDNTSLAEKPDYVSAYSLEVLKDNTSLAEKSDYISGYSLEVLLHAPKEEITKSEYISAYSVEVLINIPLPSPPLWASAYSLEVLTSYAPTDTRTHYLAGTVLENTTPVNRTVVAYDQTSFIKVGQTTSVDGYFSMLLTTTVTCFVVCYDDDAGLSYNNLVAATVQPVTVSG